MHIWINLLQIKNDYTCIHNMIWMNYYLICNIGLHLGQTLDDTVILDSPNKLFAMLWFQDNGFRTICG